jgi:RNA ligase (TIGR02306 family)
MTERKLASIRQIKSIEPIPGADRIEKLTIDGWQLVSEKGNFKPGDLCVYFEIDSYLPIDERFEFLRKCCYKEIRELGQEGFRLRTIKLRGQVSQGLALPLDKFPEIVNPKVGDDVTEVLKVRKYEPPLPVQLSGSAKGFFPSFIPKTDVERIQNLFPDEIDVNLRYEVSIKLDGTSMTVYYKDGNTGVCSKNLELVKSENAYWQGAEKTLEVLNKLKRNLAIQGELIGPGIQKNREKLTKVEFYIYNIFDIDKQEYFTSEERLKFIEENELNSVPVIGYIEPERICTFVLEDFKYWSIGKSLNSDCREGVVFKSKNKQFKVINNEYLLKYED